MRPWIHAVESALYCPEVAWQIPLGSVVHTLQAELAGVNVWIQFSVGSDFIEKLQAGGKMFKSTREESRRLHNACEARLCTINMADDEAKIAAKLATWRPDSTKSEAP